MVVLGSCKIIGIKFSIVVKRVGSGSITGINVPSGKVQNFSPVFLVLGNLPTFLN